MSDLRTKRTRANIKSAFMTLRAKKPLEKISIKELAELAEINKATFYLHYRDIYDLSDQIEDEILTEGLNTLDLNDPALDDPAVLVRSLIAVGDAHRDDLGIVFSFGRESVLPDKLEEKFKAYYYRENPHVKENLYADVLLSFMIQGAYRAYVKHNSRGALEVLSLVTDISHNLKKLYQNYPADIQKTEM